jgi:hypothetical protein
VVVPDLQNAPAGSAPSAASIARLEAAVRAALACADDAGLQTVALPLLGAGIYGWPPAVAAQRIVRACLAYLAAAGPRCGIETVLLVDVNTTAAAALADALRAAAAGRLATLPGSAADAVVPAATAAAPGYQWAWLEDPGKVAPGAEPWVPYDSDQNYQVEDRYRRWQSVTGGDPRSGLAILPHLRGDRHSVQNGFTYEVHFAYSGEGGGVSSGVFLAADGSRTIVAPPMVQRNQQTGRLRQLRRKELPPPSPQMDRAAAGVLLAAATEPLACAGGENSTDVRGDGPQPGLPSRPPRARRRGGRGRPKRDHCAPLGGFLRKT